MKTTKMLAVVLSLAAVAACGNKNKKESTAGGDGSGVGESSGGDKSNNKLESPDMGGGGGKDPNLQEIVYFEFDSSDLDEAGRAKLEENANWLKQSAERTLTIEGHTDEVGTPEYNLGLGERRAQASRDYLLRLGIDAKRVSIITFGEEKPAGSEDSQNRRSVFIATKKK
jgi:peptidoglycan-associated lipoprotein